LEEVERCGNDVWGKEDDKQEDEEGERQERELEVATDMSRKGPSEENGVVMSLEV
jgi:hypothetical protein